MTTQNYSTQVIDPYDGVIEQPVAIPVAMTASPQPSTYTNQLPPFPPKDSDDRQCIAWSCGGIVCAIVSCTCILVILPLIIWLIVASRMQSGFDDNFNNGDDFFNTNTNARDAINDLQWDDALQTVNTNGFGN